jgi:hypothetical protein
VRGSKQVLNSCEALLGGPCCTCMPEPARRQAAHHSPLPPWSLRLPAAVDKADKGWQFSTGFICEDMIRDQLFPGGWVVQLLESGSSAGQDQLSSSWHAQARQPAFLSSLLALTRRSLCPGPALPALQPAKTPSAACAARLP